MNQQARKIWNSPQGVNLFQQVLSGKPLQAQHNQVVQQLKQAQPPQQDRKPMQKP